MDSNIIYSRGSLDRFDISQDTKLTPCIDNIISSGLDGEEVISTLHSFIIHIDHFPEIRDKFGTPPH